MGQMSGANVFFGKNHLRLWHPVLAIALFAGAAAASSAAEEHKFSLPRQKAVVVVTGGPFTVAIGSCRENVYQVKDGGG